MKQEYESSNTSVNTTKLPAIYSKIDWLTLRAFLFSHRKNKADELLRYPDELLEFLYL